MSGAPSLRLVTGGALGAAGAIIAAVFAVEGGFADNKNDPGGKTNHGVTEVVARKHGFEGDMRELPKDLAASIYYEDYIRKPGFVPIIELSQAVGHEVVDSGVNAGPERPARWFQTALNAYSVRGTKCPQIAVDGQIGPATVAAYQCFARVRGKVKACELMLKALDAQQGAYYLSISQSNPKLQDFTAGWFDHRIGNVPVSRCAA